MSCLKIFVSLQFCIIALHVCIIALFENFHRQSRCVYRCLMFIDVIACLNMSYSFRLMRPLNKVETYRDSSFALYIRIINCIDK